MLVGMSTLTLSRKPIALPGAFLPTAPALAHGPGPAFPTASLFLLVATALYLCVELPFAARLVDVLATDATEAEIHAVESTGRLISGLALTLAAWGYVLRPRKPGPANGRTQPRKPLATALRLAAVALVCIMAMFVGQRTLVDRIAEEAGPSLRRAALKAAVLRHALHGVPDEVRGLTALSAPGASALAFKGAAASLATVAPDPFALLADPDRATRAFAVAGYPSLSRFRADAYEPALAQVRTSYEAYRRGAAALAGAQDRGLQAAERAWSETHATLRSMGVRDLGSLPVRERVARRLRERGIPVPADWDPRDRATLVAAAVGQARAEAAKSYATAVQAHLGPGVALPADLGSFDRFLAAGPVQAHLRKALGIGSGGPALRQNPSDVELAATAYAAARAVQVGLLRGALTGTGQPIDDARLSEPAKSAVRLAVAPALALVLSALGAFGHIAKMLHHGLALLSGPARAGGRRLAAGFLLLACLCAASPFPRALQETRLWSAAAASPLAWAVAWSVGAHGLIHPLGSALSGLPGLPLAERAAASFAR